uniref:TonB-dependent receptor n=1 Tax=Roseihalotalea indica TaxID=2867963 RepID=A0AA49JDD1_9BACT|nr:TonB-dependent receptor [Tunicatimonas sp. TK19036]
MKRFVLFGLLWGWLIPVAIAQQQVSGTVKDLSTGEALPGVNILIKNTSQGTVTDVDGNFTLQVSEDDAILVFSSIGYERLEVPVGSQSTIDIELAPDLTQLSEVVVIGYGTQKKSDVTGAITQVSGESLREVPVANFSQALQGRAAGVEITNTSSRPGGDAQIRIRGSRSLTGSNDPLIVLDGIPFNGSINDINVNDIASINVLKDASSTAIYGSRGSNGVIIISTKRGQTGEPELFYNGYYGPTSAIDKYELMNGQEFAAFRQAASEGGSTFTFTPDEEANLAAGRSTDWQDLLYQPGFMTDHNIGTRGGTENTQYYLSAGYFKQTTVLPGQAYTRYSVTGTIDQEINDRIRIGLNTMNQFNINDGENISLMFSLLTLSPLYSAYNDDGTINTNPAEFSANPETLNPLLINRDNEWKQQRRRLRTFNSLYGEVDIMDGLKYRLNVGLDLFQDNYGTYSGSQTPFRNGSVNAADIENTNSWSYTIENLLTYDKTFAGEHQLNVTALYSIQEIEQFRSAANAQDLPADYTYYYNLGLANTSSVPAGTSYYSKSAILSYMGRVNYSYADRYLLTASYRADGSSRLASGNKWYYYPAVALGWNISNESFMSGIGAISNLKLRAGYGITSNQAVDPYASLGSLTSEPYNFGESGLYGYYVNQLPNSSLSWEFTTTTNLGLDFGLLSDRITGSLELYQQKTEDILQSVSLPATSGVSSVVKNVGESENKGVEFSISSVNITDNSSDGRGFRWTTDFNFYLNRGKITYLAGGVDRNINNGWFVGQPIGAIYDYEKIGIVQTGDTELPDGFEPGEIKIKDQITVDTDGDGVADATDGVINADDRIVLGSPQPTWAGGMTNSFSYKGFDLSFVLFWKVGGTLVSTVYQANQSNPINNLEGRRNGPRVDYWTPENPTNEFPQPGTGQQPDYGSTLGYYDASFMKVRSINLGYNIPETWFGNSGISSLRVYVRAQNPFQAFFSDYVKMGGIDPEPTQSLNAGDNTTTNTPGFGEGSLVVGLNTPPTRAILFGVNLKF